MSFARRLGEKMAKRAFLEPLGEGVVGLLNRLAPKMKPGLSLATNGIAPRLAKMEATHLAPFLEAQALQASKGIQNADLAGQIAHRSGQIDSVRQAARAARMKQIGIGALGAGAGLAATQLSPSPEQHPM